MQKNVASPSYKRKQIFFFSITAKDVRLLHQLVATYSVSSFIICQLLSINTFTAMRTTGGTYYYLFAVGTCITYIYCIY